MGQRAFCHDLFVRIAEHYQAGASARQTAIRFRIDKRTVRRALDAVGARRRTHREAIDLVWSKRARSVEQARLVPAKLQRTPVDAAAIAAGISHSIHILRAHARLDGPISADEGRVAAAHAAGLTLDDIEAVFAIPPAEAVAMIAAGHGGR